MESISTNKKVVAQFFEEITNGNVETAFSLVRDDVSWWIPGTLPFSGTKTKDQYLQVVKAITTGFPDGFSLKVSSMTAEDNRIAAEVESFGKHVNGKTYNNKYHFLVVLKEGKFIEVKEYMDTLHLYNLLQK